MASSCNIVTKDIPAVDKFKKNSDRLCKLARKINAAHGDGGEEDWKMSLLTTLVSKADPEDMMTRFITNTRPEWEMIAKTDVNYFKQNADKLFGFMGDKVVIVMRDVVSSPTLSDKHRNKFWNLVKALVVNAIDYLKPEPGHDLIALKKSVVSSMK